MKVIRGYGPVPEACCPYCKESHGAFEDDGDPETVKYLCWCGASARVRRDDPDLQKYLK